ncbi:hypothetical protein D9758_006429 [Tetrapyrgos nigripes]|uniref:Uncharacterized protein n=1 Tax=Tetrapyrgos nigripes TaxID=182062 RepID=A0A8H5DA76_9AGAR|nr:hypothetical protein D9758_006429 [Tetrapyrgos nigripes]
MDANISRCYVIWGSRKIIVLVPAFLSIVDTGEHYLRLLLYSSDNDEEALSVVTLIAYIVEQAALMGSKGIVASEAEKTISIEGINSESFSRAIFIEDKISKAVLAVNFFTNLLIPLMIINALNLTTLQAGRIWWIGRQASVLIPRETKLIKRTIAICLESGMIYPIAILVVLIVNTSGILAWSGDTGMIAVLTQVVGIAPTFVIVRVVLGISFEELQSTEEKDSDATTQGNSTLISILEENRTLMFSRAVSEV